MKIENEIDRIINYIKETKEYYTDGVDEELIDMLLKLKKLCKLI